MTQTDVIREIKQVIKNGNRLIAELTKAKEVAIKFVGLTVDIEAERLTRFKRRCAELDLKIYQGANQAIADWLVLTEPEQAEKPVQLYKVD